MPLPLATHRALRFLILVLVQICLPALARGQETQARRATEVEETDTAATTQPEIDKFTPLWTRSLFTSGVAPAPAPQPQLDTEWARPLSLLGWSEVEGVVTVYLYRADTEETFVLTKGALPEEGVLQAVEVENPGSLLEAKVRVRLNGQEALIAQFESASSPDESSTQPPKASDTTVQPPTTVDSRAQRLTEPVLFTEDNTFEKSLQPARSGAAAKPDEASPASEVIQELRDRNESLYDQYPRSSPP